MKLSIYLYGLSAVAAGVINVVWHDFTTSQQPIQAFGDHVPGREIFALVTAVWLFVGGVAILRRRTAAAGAVALAIVYFIFAVFWMWRLYAVPRILGFQPNVIIGILVGVGEQLILVAAAVLVYAMLKPQSARASNAAAIARTAFGVSCLIFGINHFTGLPDVVAMIPKLPLGGAFWAVVTGTGFVLAGIAILTGIWSVLAARLLAVMLFVFSVLVLAPIVLAAPHAQVGWGINAFNLAAVAAAWILADYLADRLPAKERRDAKPQASLPF